MAMTLPEAAMYYEYAEKHPPLAWMVESYLEAKSKRPIGKKPANSNKEGSMDELIAMFGAAGGAVKR
jgi:hypothetical protein